MNELMGLFTGLILGYLLWVIIFGYDWYKKNL